MQITLTLDISPTTSPIAVHQLLDWAHRINTGQTGDSIPAPKANGGAPTKAQVLFNQLVETQQVIPPLAPVGEIEAEEDGEEVSQPTVGAVPPGVETPKRKGGRPSKAMLEERARLAAEEAVKVNPALVPQQTVAPQPGNGAAPLGMGNGPRPPGMTAVAPQITPQPPAMPAQSDDDGGYSNGLVTKTDLLDVFQRAWNHNHKGVFPLMRSPTWSDGTSKPMFLSIERVVPEFYDRLYSELEALLPTEAG